MTRCSEIIAQVTVVGSVDLDAMVLAMPTLAELTGILSDPSKRPLAALFLANL